MKLNIQLFASLNVGDTYETSAVNIKPYGYSSNAYQMKFTVKLNSQDTNANTSNITITSYMRTTGNSWGWSGFNKIYMERYTKANSEAEYTLKNSTQLTSLPTNNANNWVNCGSWTGNIQHRSDGTCDLYVKSHLLTSTSSSYSYIPKDTEQVSELLTLNQLHKPPTNVRYTITETNSLLTSAGISNNLFVENLSIKQINVTGDLHDSATVDRVGVYNRITAYSNTANPVTLNLKNITLQKNDAGTKIPLVGYIKDSFTTQGLSSSLDNPDLYDFITYRNIGITEPQTFAKRYGQLSGQVKLTISGTYFNGTIGNKNQSGSYKPTIKYKFWKLGDSEPSTYANTISASNITVSNGTFSVSGLNIGSTTTSASNYFNPNYSYRLKIQVSDNFTTYTSVEKVITKGEPVWSEYKDRLMIKKIHNPQGIYSLGTGNVNTPVGNSNLIIKRVNNTEAPNNGVVLEFGNSTNWTGQLYIGDNATQGIYYNGWSNGTRGTWKRLQFEPVVLYDNSSGANGTITLNDSSANYSYIEIFFKNNDSYFNSVKVASPNGKYVTLMTSFVNNTGNSWLKIANKQISGTTISNIQSYTYGNLKISTSLGRDASDAIYITKVLGYY